MLLVFIALKAGHTMDPQNIEIDHGNTDILSKLQTKGSASAISCFKANS